MIRRATWMAAGVLLLGAALSPRGAAAQTPPVMKSGAMPAFLSLPEGHLAALPASKAPARIAAREKVDGFFPAGPPKAQAAMMRRYNQNVSMTYVFADSDTAKEFNGSRARRPNQQAKCFIDGGDAESLVRTEEQENEGRNQWPANYSDMLTLQFQTAPVEVASGRPSKQRMGGEIHALRSERFVEGTDGHAALDVSDVWFDARTHGTRLIEHATLPVLRVFAAPDGTEVYAARDGDTLQVVLHTPEHLADDPALAEQLRARRGAFVVILPGGNGASSDCGHMRFPLQASLGAGEMATLQGSAFLPSLDPPPGDPSEIDGADLRAQRLISNMRTRPFQLSVSATASSADPRPVLSISAGWIGREGPSSG